MYRTKVDYSVLSHIDDDAHDGHKQSCSLCKSVNHCTCCTLGSKCLNLSITVSRWLCLTCTTSIFPFNHIENDQEFKGAILNSTQESITQFLANLPTDIVFNPFEQYEEGSALLTDTDVDPDTNYFNTKTLCTSKYVCVEEINTALHPSNSQSFSILHLNCRSLFHKLTDIQLLLLQSNATVVAVT